MGQAASSRKKNKRSLAPDLLEKIVEVQHAVATSDLGLEKVMSLIVIQTAQLTGADGGVIEIVENDEMVYRAVSGSVSQHLGLRLKVAASLSGNCVQSGQILRCDDVETDARVDKEACRKIGVRSMILVPLQHKGEVVGVLKVLSATPAHFIDAHIHVLQLMSGLLAASMGNSSAFNVAIERQKAEERLRASEARFFRAFENAPNGIALASLGGHCMVANPAFCAMIGFTQEELVGKSFADLSHPEDKDIGYSKLSLMLANNTEFVTVDKRYIHKNGEVVWVTAHGTLVREASGRLSIFCCNSSTRPNERRPKSRCSRPRKCSKL